MKINTLYNALALTAGLLPAAFQTAEAGSLTQTINFNATFYGGSCEITAPAQLPYNNGNPIPDDSIKGAPYKHDFDVTLANCQGYFMTPRITVTGNTTPTPNGVKVFADASSTTKGYGVQMSTNGNTNFNANSNAAINNVISARSWPAAGSDNAASLNGPLRFRATLSCGTCTAGSNLRNGELIATVTFSFLYD